MSLQKFYISGTGLIFFRHNRKLCEMTEKFSVPNSDFRQKIVSVFCKKYSRDCIFCLFVCLFFDDPLKKIIVEYYYFEKINNSGELSTFNLLLLFLQFSVRFML